MLFELQKALEVVDGQQIMLEAREIKSIDEIALLNRAAAMVDGAYHLISEQLKPGVRQADVVAMATEFLCRNGSDDVEAINAISGERCNPHPHNFTDRMIRPGDQAFFDILQSFMGYRTCYYRTFNVGRATPAQDDAYNDTAGVTARFNLNLLARINRELGADFDPSAFEHHAIYHGDLRRIEMHLASRKAQKVRVCGRCFEFRAGETIHTENRYNYTVDGFAALARGAGWTNRAAWTDAREYFSVHALTIDGAARP